MAFHGILIQKSVEAENIDSLNRSVVGAVDIDNGNVFTLSSYSATAGQGEVWSAATPVTGSLANLWMAYEPEVVITLAGTKQYKGLSPDPRDFYNIAGNVFSAFKPQIGDIIVLTDEALAGTKGSNGYVVATNADMHLNWAAAAVSGLSLKLQATTYVSIADGSIGTQRKTAYKFEVVAI